MRILTARSGRELRALVATIAPVTTTISAIVGALVPGGVEARALLADDRLRLDGVHLRLVEMIGAGDQHAQHVVAELYVALDGDDRPAWGLEEIGRAHV